MIQISLDGPLPDIHDRQRGIKGSFEMTMNGIRNIQKAGISPVINTVLTQNNYKYIPDMISFLMDNGLSRFRVLRLHPLGRGRDTAFFNLWSLAPGQNELIHEFLNQKREELVGELHISNDSACIFPMSAKSIRDKVRSIPGKVPESYACGAGTSKISIGPDGSVFPCSYMYEFPELKVGSIRENTIQELWDKDELWGFYRRPLSPSGKCNVCEYLYSCKTGCRILSYAFYGDMGAPDPGCHYQPAHTGEDKYLNKVL
jgi:radical SAM protein with 4Fe4S-binding SPASM domain